MTRISEGQNNTEQNESGRFIQTCASVINDAVSIAVLVLLTVFPLIFHNSYYDILGTKYQCYRFCIIALLVSLPFLVLWMVIVDLKKFQGRHTDAFLARLHPKSWKKTFCAVDAAALFFWVAAAVSTLQSDYLQEAFWGNEGRFSGLLMLTFYVVSFLLIFHFWKFSGAFLELFLGISMLMCLFGITDYFQMDILHFRKTGEAVAAMLSYTSTIGNINTYTAFVGIFAGLSAALFALEKKPFKQIWYYLCMVISFAAILMGRSDNAYLSIAAIFVLLPFVLFTSMEGIKRYLMIAATFITVVQLIAVVNERFAGVVLGMDHAFTIISDFSRAFWLAPIFWAIVVMFWLFSKKYKTKLDFFQKQRFGPVHMWGAFIFLLLFITCFILVDVNLLGNTERYRALSPYLIFNDTWGSSRGYIWRRSLWMYNKMPFLHKLFGCGPDTFGCLVSKTIIFETNSYLGSYLDNAHNNFLQYLVTLGIVGLAAYLVFLGTSFFRLFKNRHNTPYIPAILLAALCYVFQSAINIDVPIVTPFLWLLLAMGMAACKKMQTEHDARLSSKK
jgi:hypothetical protein